MDDRSVASHTAIMVAGLRALATDRVNPICTDPWAATLAGGDGIALGRRFGETNPDFELWIALRTAWIDGFIERHAGPGSAIGQIVLLGAGLDSRAARFGREGLTFFEVDHPETQLEKKARLADLDDYPIDGATYVGCDFSRDSFMERLAAEGFRSDVPALFIWEGVVPYLDESDVRATLRTVAAESHPDSILLFDYIMKKMAEGNRLDDRDANLRRMVGDMQEPLRFGFNDATPLMYDEGFRQLRTVSFDEIALSFTGTYERARKFRFQGIVVGSRGYALVI
jgi:methyltransferase (TIGR00027 family)